MSIIVWNNLTIAADTLALRGEMRSTVPHQKLYIDGETVYGMTGTACVFQAFRKWHWGGADPEVLAKSPIGKDDSSLLVWNWDRERGGWRCHLYAANLPYPDEMYGPTAWGCGRDFAVGAMDAGLAAEKAAAIAINRNIYLSYPIFKITLPASGGTVIHKEYIDQEDI